MKKIRYPSGCVHYETMTVGELRGMLSAYPDEMPVLAEWESIYTPFRADCATVKRLKHAREGDAGDALILWVDQD